MVGLVLYCTIEENKVLCMHTRATRGTFSSGHKTEPQKVRTIRSKKCCHLGFQFQLDTDSEEEGARDVYDNLANSIQYNNSCYS